MQSPWFNPAYPLQSTWKQLIRVVLSAEASGATPAPTPGISTEQVRAYQKEQLGRLGGLDCILELLPLPSPGLGRWLFYPECSWLPYLRNRAICTNHIASQRIAHLRARIAEHRPGTVIFYGTGYKQWWRAIAGVDFTASNIDEVSVARDEHTLYVMMQHPTARGLPNSYFDAVGRLIAQVQGG